MATAGRGRDATTRAAGPRQHLDAREPGRCAAARPQLPALGDLLRHPLRDLHGPLRRRAGRPSTRAPPVQAANRALGTAHLIFRRLLLRGIDYLPPGELSFADVGRATLAADRAAWADADASTRGAEAPARLRPAVRRPPDREGPRELDSPQPAELDLPPAQLPGLRDSDYVAYEYVGQHRDVLGIPAGDAVHRAASGGRHEAGRAGDRTATTRAHPQGGVEPPRADHERARRHVPAWCPRAPRSASSGRPAGAWRSSAATSPAGGSGRRGTTWSPGSPRRACSVTASALDVAGGVASLTRSHRLLHLEGWDE